MLFPSAKKKGLLKETTPQRPKTIKYLIETNHRVINPADAPKQIFNVNKVFFRSETTIDVLQTIGLSEQTFVLF